MGHKCYRRNIFPNSVSCIDALNKHNLLTGHAGDRGSSPGCDRHYSFTAIRPASGVNVTAFQR